MAAASSFDVTSSVDLQEVDNAVNQARKEIAQRYDFKGSMAAIEFNKAESTLTLVADDNMKMDALWDVLQTRLVRRNVSGQKPEAWRRRNRHRFDRAAGGHASAGHSERRGARNHQVPEGTETEESPGHDSGRSAAH